MQIIVIFYTLLLFAQILHALDVCGNGKLEPSEYCDDGNLLNGDGCSIGCRIDPDFNCTLSLMYPKLSVCLEKPMTGWNGHLQCDDGNTVNDDGCSNTGTVTPGYICTNKKLGEPNVCLPSCGDGIDTWINNITRCDDGNNISGDGCFSDCYVEKGFYKMNGTSKILEVCGDGIDHGYLECDDGNTFSGDGCSSICKIETGY